MAHQITPSMLGDIIRNNAPLVVPKYQRGYSWEQSQVDDCVEDAGGVLDIEGGEQVHFMGGLVTVGYPRPRPTEIVDGQQRLATLSLMMAALVHGLETLRGEVDNAQLIDDYKAQISENYLYTMVIVDGRRAGVPRLHLSSYDHDYFISLLEGTPLTEDNPRESHILLKQAYHTIYEGIVEPILAQDESGEQRAALLLEAHQAFADRFEVVEVHSTSLNEAYQLFAVLNDRGRTLTEGDLLRARTLEALEGDPRQDEVEGIWNVLLAGGANEALRFFRTYYPSIKGLRARKDLFRDYRDEFIEGKSPDDVHAFVLSLRAEHRVYVALRVGEWPFPEGEADHWDRDRLFRLVNILGHDAAHPLLMAAYHTGEAKFKKVVRLVERAVFRYITVVGAHATALYMAYYSQVVAMRENSEEYQVETLRVRLNQLMGEKAPDETFQALLLEKLQYSSNGGAVNRVIRHFLTTLDSYWPWLQDPRGAFPRPETTTFFDALNSSVEHIHSQNPEQETPEMDELVHRLGNLLAVGQDENNRYANGDYVDKQPRMVVSNHPHVREAANYNQWTPGELRAREEELTRLASLLFRI